MMHLSRFPHNSKPDITDLLWINNRSFIIFFSFYFIFCTSDVLNPKVDEKKKYNEYILLLNVKIIMKKPWIKSYKEISRVFDKGERY